MRRSRTKVKPNIGGSKGGPLSRPSSRSSITSTSQDKQEETSEKGSESGIINVPTTTPLLLGGKQSRLARFASLNSKPDTVVAEIDRNISNATETDLSSSDSNLGERTLTPNSTEISVTDLETQESADKDVITAEKSQEIELTEKASLPEKFTVIKEKTVQTFEPKEKETTAVSAAKVQCSSSLLKNTKVKNLYCTENAEQKDEVITSKHEVITSKQVTTISVEKDEKHDDDKGAKMPAPRPRSRFTKARPNLGEAVRPRIRNLSGGGDVITKEFNKPSAQRTLSTTKENATHTGVAGKCCIDGSNNNILENKLVVEENDNDSVKGVTSDREKAKKKKVPTATLR